ncbi:MAG: YqzL family protein [Deltaproteobacteria bacterium]
MITEVVWKTFEKTGDLNAYLLLKEIETTDPEGKKEEKKD